MKNIVCSLTTALLVTGCAGGTSYPGQDRPLSVGNWNPVQQEEFEKKLPAEDKEALTAVYLDQPVKKVPGLKVAGRYFSSEIAIPVANKAYRDTGDAKPIIGNSVITYPYGREEARLACIPYHVCGIELQEGEQVNEVVVADFENWNASLATTGSGANQRTVVFMKTYLDRPTTSNLMITTDRRVYNVTLRSKTHGTYTPRIKFYYPGDFVKYRRQQDAEKSRLDKMTVATTAIDINNLNFHYRIEDGDGKPWTPLRAFDDGRKVFLQMPASMDVTEAPVFLEKRSGKLAIVNYRVKNGYFIIDKLFEEGILKLGVDDEAETVTIKRG